MIKKKELLKRIEVLEKLLGVHSVWGGDSLHAGIDVNDFYAQFGHLRERVLALDKQKDRINFLVNQLGIVSSQDCFILDFKSLEKTIYLKLQYLEQYLNIDLKTEPSTTQYVKRKIK